MKLNLAFFQNKRVFVTGHTGFKGSWLCRALVSAGARVTGYSLPAPDAPNLFSLAGTEENMTGVYGDIRNIHTLYNAFEAARPEIVLHLAAQPLVRESYKEPLLTFETNVMGTVNLLECARLVGGVRSMVNVTTDKVYLNREWCWGYRENDPLDGFDPYSNSKSCSELVTHSYVSSFFAGTGTAVSTARAGNVIGGGDFSADRIVPDCVRAALKGRGIRVRNPHSVRPYQHVLEPVMAYLLIAQAQWENSSLADWYNVGPGDADCVTTGDLADLFCRCWGEGSFWENQAERNAPHEADLLRLDCSKIRSRLGWKPRWNVARAMEETCAWSKVWRSGGDVAAEMDREIAAYLNT